MVSPSEAIKDEPQKKCVIQRRSVLAAGCCSHNLIIEFIPILFFS
jgi:hypothetical protein